MTRNFTVSLKEFRRYPVNTVFLMKKEPVYQENTQIIGPVTEGPYIKLSDPSDGEDLIKAIELFSRQEVIIDPTVVFGASPSFEIFTRSELSALSARFPTLIGSAPIGLPKPPQGKIWFRYNRGTLEDSLATAVAIEPTIEALLHELKEGINSDPSYRTFETKGIGVSFHCFDARVPQECWLVYTAFDVIGTLSAPLINHPFIDSRQT